VEEREEGLLKPYIEHKDHNSWGSTESSFVPRDVIARELLLMRQAASVMSMYLPLMQVQGRLDRIRGLSFT